MIFNFVYHMDHIIYLISNLDNLPIRLTYSPVKEELTDLFDNRVKLDRSDGFSIFVDVADVKFVEGA